MTGAAALGSILLYVRDVERSPAFDRSHFGYVPVREAGDRIVEMHGPAGSANVMLHPAAKLPFDVKDMQAFVAVASANGLDFGALYSGDGYCFANAEDPDGTSISVSSRACRKA